MLTLVVRRDTTWDYWYGPGGSPALVVQMLRQMADQIESGCTVPNSPSS